MDKKTIKYVAVIQCEKTRRRCSGFACSEAFFDRKCAFNEYEPDTKYVTMSCGGCCGTAVAGQLEHFGKKLRTVAKIKKSEVAVHLSSCMVTDNRHHDRCPHVDYIKTIAAKNGFENVIEGSYQSNNTSKKRATGEYKNYDTVVFD